MKKKTRKRSLCLLLAAALLLTSIPFDMTTSSKAEEKGTVVRDGEYTTGIFAGEHGIDQLFDYVMMTLTLCFGCSLPVCHHPHKGIKQADNLNLRNTLIQNVCPPSYSL